MNEANYDFHVYYKDGSTVSLEFCQDEDEMNCYRLHDLCKRFAAALGYMPETIEEVFGLTQYEEML